MVLIFTWFEFFFFFLGGRGRVGVRVGRTSYDFNGKRKIIEEAEIVQGTKK